MRTTPPQLFSAARIATVLGVAPKAMETRLRAVPFAGLVRVDGRDVRAWTWRALDDALRADLDKQAAAGGYSSGEQLLAHASIDWQTVPCRDRERASRLCRALRGAMEARLAGQPAAVVSRAALEGYQGEFGYTVQAEWVDSLVARVVLRDAGANQFARLHLYIPDRCFSPQEATLQSDPKLLALHDRLEDSLSVVADASAPTVAERDLLLSAAYRHLSDLVAEQPGVPDASLKSSLLDWLLARVPGLASSREAMRKRFERGLKRWAEGGRTAEALVDGRSQRARKEYPVCDACIRKIHDAAANYHGRVTLAYRELRKRGLLCEACMEGIAFDLRRRKSYMPRGLRQRVTPSKLTLAFLRSPRDAQLIGPHSERDHSDILAGDVFVADDLTSNERVPYPLPGGRWEFFKVQFIAAIDFKSGKWLDFVAHFGHPYSWSIQRLWLQLFHISSVGMPRRGLYLERGAFNSAIASQGMVESGCGIRAMLDRFNPGAIDGTDAREVFENLRVRRAKLPMGKPIEGDLGQLQHRTSILPGHMGFNERLAKFDKAAEFMNLCRSGKADPREKGWLPIDDLILNYRRFMEEMNAEPQNGRRCRGASPNELWAEDLSNRPLERLPESQLWLFSTTRKMCQVKSSGISLRLDENTLAPYFGNPRLAELEGRKVEVVYNALLPDFITVRVTLEDTFIVKRQQYPSNTATPEQLKEMHQAKWNHMGRARLLAGNLSHPLAFTIEREDKFPEAQVEMGLQHNRAVAEANEGRDLVGSEISALRRQATALGMPLRPELDLSKPRIREAVRGRLLGEQQKRERANQ